MIPPSFFRPSSSSRRFRPTPARKGIKEMWRPILRASVAALLLTAALGKAATTGTWNVNTSGAWSNPANWSGGTIPGTAAGGAGGDVANLTFNITANVLVTLDSTRTLGALTIGDGTTQSNSYTLASGAGASLVFDNGGTAATLTQNTTSNGDTISASTVLNDSLNVVNNNATKALTLSGDITAGKAGTKIITIGATAAGGVNISGNIGAGSGDIAIVKNNGASTLTLSGNNTFTGGVTLTTGVLNLTSATALGASGSALTITGGTITGNTAITNGNAQKWNGNFSFGGTTNLDMGTGAVTMNANRTVTVTGSGTYTVGGAIGGAFSLSTANGTTGQITGKLVLNGANGYTGGTNVNGGVVQFGNVSAIPATGNIVVGAGGALAVSGAYNTLAGWLSETHLAKSSTGALALLADSSENFDPGAAGYNSISMGAAVGTTVNYTGTITPAGGTYRVGGGGGTLNLPNANTITGNNALAVGSGGGGLVVIAQSNDYTGTTTVTAGTLQIGTGGTTGSIDNTSNIVANGTLAFNHSDNVTLSKAISGTGGIAQSGTGVLIVNGTSNTYATTSINRSTLRLGATNALPTASTLNIGSGANAGTFDMSTFSQTLGSLNFTTTNSTPVNTITIGAGQTLTVNGAFNVGVPGQSGITTKAVITGGALVVNNTAANFEVGLANADQNTAVNNASLDITGISSFSANVNEFRVGYGSQIGSTLKLSNTSNTITANTVQVSSSNNNNAQACSLTLGTGTNIINADLINLGVSKGNATLSFASQTAGPGTVVIGGKTGAAVNIVMANSAASSTGANLIGLLDLRGHNSTVTAGTVTLATRDAGAGGGTGTIFFDTGTFTVNSLTLATKTTTSAASTATGIINLSGGAFIVNPGGNFTMATQSGAGFANGTLNITGGTFTSNVDIVDGGGATTTTITLDGGTLDLAGHNIGSSATPVDALNFKSGTLANVNQINGTAGLNKVAGGGANTLSLAGTNSYTGATTVTAGILLVNGSIDGSMVTVNSGATLGGIGQINLGAGQSVAVNGTLAPGKTDYGLLTVEGGSGVAFNSATLSLQVTDSNQDKLVIDGDASSNFSINGTSALKIEAGKPGSFTIASWTGSHTGFFNSISVNGGTESYTVSTSGDITTYTFTSGHGSLVYDDDAKDLVVNLTIPEPVSVLSLATGSLALLGLTRPRRRRG